MAKIFKWLLAAGVALLVVMGAAAFALHLWISTDGMQGIAYCDALFKVPLVGEDRGRVQQFLATPINSETTGPVIHDRDGSVFVAVQHPGDGGSWVAQQSLFPDYLDKREARPGDWRGPRPSVVQVIRHRPR